MSTLAPAFPFVALLVSGGHSQLMRVSAIGEYTLLGETLDDAAGEAFDKTAKLLGLGYPGGPVLARLADTGTPRRYRLPRPMLASGDLEMSFSGLKTAVLTEVRRRPLDEADCADLAAEFQEAIVEVLVAKSLAALKQEGLDELVVAGGVGANRRLRTLLDERAARAGARVYYPPIDLCTDNGAMVAFAAAQRIGRFGLPATGIVAGFTVRPRWGLDALPVGRA
jgi:N6-L-threonylcarbamoyladenine synthase